VRFLFPLALIVWSVSLVWFAWKERQVSMPPVFPPEVIEESRRRKTCLDWILEHHPKENSGGLLLWWPTSYGLRWPRREECVLCHPGARSLEYSLSVLRSLGPAAPARRIHECWVTIPF